MIVVIHTSQDTVTEFAVRPGGENQWHIMVNNKVLTTNNAGLQMFIQLKANPAEPFSRCIQAGETFRCPFPTYVCVHGKPSEQAILWRSTFEPFYEPVGQMSLFEQNVTHRLRWQDTSGRRVDAKRRPYTATASTCKKMSVAVMEWMKRNGWDGLRKITPAGNSKIDRQWQFAQMAKYEDRYDHCVFEEV